MFQHGEKTFFGADPHHSLHRDSEQMKIGDLYDKNGFGQFAGMPHVGQSFAILSKLNLNNRNLG